MTADAIADTIRSFRFAYGSEDRLQQGLAEALAEAGLPVEREVRLDARSRIDLMVGRVGVEVKVAGSGATLRRQASRYLASDEIDGLVVVTDRVRHRLPRRLFGKPVAVVQIAAQGL